MLYVIITVVQRVLEHCEETKTQSKVMEEILGCVSMLAQDQYGNYVIQVRCRFSVYLAWIRAASFLLL